MKKYLFILITIPFMLASCGNNDEPVNPGVVGEVTLTVDNLVGTWEVYNMEKIVNNDRDGLRYIDYDGFTTTYYKDGTFEDRNPFGDLIYSGHFSIKSIEGKDAIEYNFKTRKTKVDTTTVQYVSALKDKFLTIYGIGNVNLEKNKYTVKDIKSMRNVAKAPGESPNMNKAALDYNRLIGSWKLYDYYYYLNSELDLDISSSKKEKYEGTTYTFNSDKTVSIADPGGLIKGPIRIIDDVIYIKDVEGRNELKDNVEGDEGFYIWIKDLSATSFTDQTVSRSGVNIDNVARSLVFFKKN